MTLFEHPGALLALPVWGAAMWLLPRARLWRPMRVMVFLLFLTAWLNPVVNRKTPGLDLWVLNDLSLSTRDTVQPRLAEMESLLGESRGPRDRLFFVDFAEEAVVRDELSAAVLAGRRDATAIGNALQHTLSRLEDRRHSRLLLLSDGCATDALDLAGERLLDQGVPLDLRLTRPEAVADVRIEEFAAPLRTRPGEPFLIETRLAGPSGTAVAAILSRDGREIGRADTVLRRGGGLLRWTGRMDRPGAAEYEVEIEAAEDAYPGNNRQSQWVEALGAQRVLLITAYPDDPVAPFIRQTGIEVETVTDPGRLESGSLGGVAAVVLHNVYAPDIPREFLEALPFFVREQGGGLLMVGGKRSFGAGGYFQSPVDELLPVSMELKEEDRRLSVAMAIVMDRSGSMSASAGGATKMDLANSGAARAIELLGAMDAVTVFAVDTEAHEIAPLSQVGENRERLLRMVRSIQSAGGGIYVFNGLDAAWRQLRDSPREQRHVILFADAADAEQPQGVGKLLREMTERGATVSVIALGTERDPDAPFLEQIAEDGGGRLFFNADATTLPEVFAQETVTVSRSAFLDQPVGVEAAAGWRELAAAPLDWPGQVDGYNLSYLREGAAESLRSTDEYGAPLLAHWQRGAGRVAAVSFPLGGEFSDTVRSWDRMGDLVRTLARWSVRPELPPGLALRIRRIGETVRLQLHADEEWREKLTLDAPKLVVASNQSDGARELAWRRMKPGLLETDLELRARERVRGAIRIGGEVLPFGPVSGVGGAEWRFDPETPARLRRLSAASGGEDRVDLAGIWDSPKSGRPRGTWTWWLTAAGLLFLAEALWSRLGGGRPEMGFRRRRPVRNTAAPEPGPAPPPPEPDTPGAPERRAAFRQARHRGKL